MPDWTADHNANHVVAGSSGMENHELVMDCGQLPEGTFDLSSSPLAMSLSKGQGTPSRLSRSPSVSPPTARPVRGEKASSSAASPVSPTASDCKRRRFTSSPVRPWKSPSPADQTHEDATPHTTPASNLLRHISVIREVPPVLKPQVMAASYHHHHTAHHYHPLVDPYAAAYHLYKSTPAAGNTMTAGAAAASTGHPHHWGSYN